MIKPTQLRIGNLVTLSEKIRKHMWYNHIHAENHFFDVQTIYSDKDVALQLDEEIVDLSQEDIEPIMLEKEWLRAFGAEINSSNNYILDRFEFIWKEGYNYWYVLGEESSTYLTKIEYVHELQNFYFVMNGEDLVLLKEIGKEYLNKKS